MINLAAYLTMHQFPYELYEHPAIYTNESAVEMKEKLGFTGTETKSLFLQGKDGTYFIYLTYTTRKADFKRLSRLVGQRLSLVPTEKMEKLTRQKAGAVSPLGYSPAVTLLVDTQLFNEEKIVFAPGHPDRTMVLNCTDLRAIIHQLGNPLIEV